MKIRELSMVLFLVLAVSACRKEYTDSVVDDAVHFSTVLSVASSKASVAETDNFLPSMGVFCSATDIAPWDALLHSPDKMFHTKMVNTNYGVVGAATSVWDYAVDGDKAYWGSGLGARFTFFGYAPYASSDNGISLISMVGSKGVPTVRYDAPVDVSKRVDFVVAEPRVNIHPMGSVGLNMRHALSAVRFEVKLSKAYAGTMKVKSITLQNVQQGGNLSLTVDPTNGVAWTVDYSEGKQKDEVLSTANILEDKVLTATYASVVKSGQALFVVPQPMTPPAAHTTLSSISMAIVFNYDGVDFVAPSITLGSLPEWKAGSTYTYQITCMSHQGFLLSGCSVVDWADKYTGSEYESI